MARRQLSNATARVSRQAIWVVGGFLLGIAVAALISSVQTARTAPQVSDADYVLMVADLFDREKSVFNARDRLLQIGKDPLDMAEAALERTTRERPENRRDADALRQLAQGLRQGEAVQPTRASTGPGFVGLVALILASVVLAAGAAWIWKQLETRGLRAPRIGVPRADRTPLSGGLSGRTLMQRGMAAAMTQIGSRRRGGAVADPSEDEAPASRRPETRARAGEAEAAVARRQTARHLEPAESSHAVETYEARYAMGDEEYDEIHPILDANGDLIGACGLSATESSGRPGRFYGFTAWLQTYGRQNELSAVGLVSRGGQLARSAAIAEWERRGTIDEVRSVERGLRIDLSTQGITAGVTILDFDYAAPAHGSAGYFGRLTVRYEITPTGR